MKDFCDDDMDDDMELEMELDQPPQDLHQQHYQHMGQHTRHQGAHIEEMAGLQLQHQHEKEQEQEEDQEEGDDYPTVVLDCANIGWAFGMDSFSSRGVQLAYQFFQGFRVHVLGFLPASYYKRRPKDGSRGNAVEQVTSGKWI